ncbi:hypothetical protein WBJ53_14955 [Spirosoma sp. SC4-14]|uniref:hypothetical protein n=1 Tax=Spirosoma sp. SC4-14 TaxID=3128900 RepID=UPI0030CB86E6
MSFVGIEEALTKKGGDFIEAVVVSQRQKKLRASGRSAASLHKRVTRSGTVLTLEILGAAYFYQQQNGRRPSSKRPSRAMVESIKEWTKIRGINIPAYAIAMKIQRDGIKVPNPFNPGGVLSEPLNPDKVRSSLKVAIRPILIEGAKSTFFK